MVLETLMKLCVAEHDFFGENVFTKKLEKRAKNRGFFLKEKSGY